MRKLRMTSGGALRDLKEAATAYSAALADRSSSGSLGCLLIFAPNLVSACKI